MKLVSANASLLRSLSDGATDEELDRLLEKYFAATHAMQLVCSDTLVIKRLREHSREHDNIALLNTILPSEHAVQIRRLIASRWLVLQRVPPVFPSMQSMHDLLTHSRTVPSDVIQSCLAQIVALLLTAHARDAAFAHNDFKADNILLCLESRPSPVVIGDFAVKHVGVRVVLIDM
jgi:serine/threonine protein kinase